MIAFYQLIQSLHNPVADYIFVSLSFLGSEPTYILLIAILYWNVDKRFGFRLAVLFLTSMAINNLLKTLVHSTRPIGQPGMRSVYVSSAPGFSFPSGHAQGAATLYPYLWRRWPRQKMLLWIGILMITGISFSRLYLGLHWLTDILGGYLIGTMIVILFQRIDKSLFKLTISLSVKLALSLTLPLLFLAAYHTPQGFQIVGFVIGFTCGYFLEDTFLDYRERTKLSYSILKTLCGLIPLGVWVWAWHSLTTYYPWIHLPILVVGGLWTSFGAPYLFRRTNWEAPLKSEGESRVGI